MSIEVFATTLNVVAFADDPQVREWMGSQADELARRHSARTVVLDACASGGTSESGSDPVCVGVQDMPPAMLRTVICDLLVPNVRTALIWAGSRFDDERFRTLGASCESVVVDSSYRRGHDEGLRELAAIVDDRMEPVLRDLAYLRLEGWQDLIALLFDDPAFTEELNTISKVCVKSGSAVEARYLIAWIASRLGWLPSGKEEFSNPEGGQIAIELQQQKEPGIAGITLDSANCTFSVCIDEDTCELACLLVNGPKKSFKRCAPLRRQTPVALLHRAVLQSEPGDVFVEAFRMVRNLLLH